MVRIAPKNSDYWWYRAGTLILTIVSAVVLFKAADMPNVASASIAQWVVFTVCVYGLGQMYNVIFDIIAAIMERRQLQRRQGGRTT